MQHPLSPMVVFKLWLEASVNFLQSLVNTFHLRLSPLARDLVLPVTHPVPADISQPLGVLQTLTMVSLEDLIQGEAELGDESDDESFDEETGETRRKSNGTKRRNGDLDDSSEEESDDDEEAARAVSIVC